MMPVDPRPAPSDPALLTCIETYRRRAKQEPVAGVWKAFRASKCGGGWVEALHDAYGHRCLYCDHAEGWTIDHAVAKSRSAVGGFAWSNFRPACGDCNHRKGDQRIVDPVREDPRAFVVYDVATGKPLLAPSLKRSHRARGERTRVLLDLPTLNEARRARRQQVLAVLARFINGERGYGAARVLAELADQEPHRAILRDLILGARSGSHGWSPLVQRAIRLLPDLESWALAPLRTGTRANPERRRRT